MDVSIVCVCFLYDAMPSFGEQCGYMPVLSSRGMLQCGCSRWSAADAAGDAAATLMCCLTLASGCAASVVATTAVGDVTPLM